MKKLLIIISLVLGFISPVFAQKAYMPAAAESTAKIQPSYPIAGSHLLHKDWEMLSPILKEYARTHPQARSLRKTASWDFNVGSTHSWYATDLSGSNQHEYLVPSTCRAVGTHCYIFVEDASWNTRANQEVVDSVMAAFDSRTPADPVKGIYELDTQYFGDPLDIDGDPKIIILILDIKDGYSGSGGYVAGYFYSLNENYDEGLPADRHSNEAEIYYVDCNPADLKTASGRTNAESTTAHEFQHMIHYHYDPDEISFVNEGLSESAMVLCGYAFEGASLYYANTNVNFLGWNNNNSLPEYSRAGLFTWYLIEQFGTGIAKDIVQSGYPGSVLHGMDGYNDGLSKVTTLRFLDVLKNFAIAAGLNDTTYDSRYGFKRMNISTYPSSYRTFTNPNVPATYDTLEAYGTRYITFWGGDSLNATFSYDNAKASVHAIAKGSAGKKVSDVAPDTPYLENDFGQGYDKVIFVVTNIFGSKTIYHFTASGISGVQQPMEIAYDDGNPEGYFTWTTGDSVTVQFDAVPGAMLDSIRVAFRRAGSLSYGIWKYSGVMSPSPLAQNYGTGTMICTDSTPPYPYPIPYQNWVKTDVSGWNVDLNYPFAVGFAFGSDGTAPGLMMSKEPYSEPHYSFSYFKPQGGTTYQWYVVVTNNAQDSAARYLVRAYIHYVTNGIASTIVLTPKVFDLSQNYPNPFNPETSIRYAVPTKNPVRLSVYDMLGREVAILIDQVQDPGTYEVKWDGKNTSGLSVGSGVYFYRLQAGSFIKTNKMVLLR